MRHKGRGGSFFLIGELCPIALNDKPYIVGYIFARGGSKGVPGKNIKLLAGKPLLGYAIDAALACPLIDRVVVSTDDRRIADVARRCGAEVPFLRPEELARDDSPEWLAWQHALLMTAPPPDVFVSIPATAPLRSVEDVERTIMALLEADADIALTVSRSQRNPWFNMAAPGGDGYWHLVNQPDKEIHRRQDAPPVWDITTVCYAARPDFILRAGGIFEGKVAAVEVPPERAVDIDTEQDFKYAEWLMSRQQPTHRLTDSPTHRSLRQSSVISHQPSGISHQGSFQIGDRIVGEGLPCFIIAEAGVNHNGSLELALRMVDAAADAGADAVKFQTFQTGKLVTPDAPKATYQEAGTGRDGSQGEMLRSLELSEEAHRRLSERCRERGIMFLSTPFDNLSAEMLNRLGVPAFKVASGELTNHELLRHLASFGKPLIISTGMADVAEVAAAVEAVQEAGCCEFALLHCVSGYPAEPADVNLRAMKTLADRFGCPVGFSDHTLGIEIPMAAAALGACIIEKHFTLDRKLPGPDQRISLEPAELKAMIEGIRKVEAALGDGVKRMTIGEEDTARAARRSLAAAMNIQADTVLTEAMIALLRPGTGLPPLVKPKLIGKRMKRAVAAGTLLSWEMVE